ncbi:MAG: polysaccharide deacetylase family protein [Bacteroidales bacterium]|nr:polysaccharide deacetylase family protein [Bacteroidales bacterium]MCF8458648.1 polysaccharide deacetylase family protein [Bacteroidales bacterium]
MKFTITNILFGIALTFMLVAGIYDLLSFWWILPLIVVYILILFFGVNYIGWNFFINSLNKGNSTEKHIALTFDDGPNPEITPKVLALLNKSEAKAAFFCIGKNIVGHEDIVAAIHSEGHIIGNHSYSHAVTFDLMSSQKMAQEIEDTNQLIFNIIKKKPILFRPPFGVTNPNLAKAIRHTGMTSIGWSLRSFDTVKNEEQVLRKVKKKIKAGDIILFHDSSEKTIKYLEKLLTYFSENGFKIVSLDQLLKIHAYAT